jgi:hypothetical protein
MAELRACVYSRAAVKLLHLACNLTAQRSSRTCTRAARPRASFCTITADFFVRTYRLK